MSMIEWAENEMRLAGYWAKGSDEWTDAVAKSVMDLLKVFCDEGHSGSSAPAAAAMFSRLAAYKPLTALTGEDGEWNEVGDGVWQNRRCSKVFKSDEDGAYYIEGKVFWEWYQPDEGDAFKSYFTNRDSQVPVAFPYIVPEAPVYEERTSG